MIHNLRPRVLNKATTPSVIKNTEMLDAVNIVADGVDDSETNTIKKISGNIKTYLLDDYDGFEGHNAIVSAFGDDVVLGHCIDEERQRVFYFAGSPSGNGKVSSVYMLEQFSEDEMHIVLLIRSSQVLDFSSENFVDADIIRVPTSELEYAPDEDFSGTLDDSISEGGEGVFNEEAFIEVAACPINSDVLVTPTTGQSGSNLSSLLIINSSNAAFVGGSIVFGGGSPGSPVDYGNQGLTISGFNGFESGDTFNVLAQDTLEIIIATQWENSVVQEGVYDLYSQILDAEGNQVSVCNWTLEIVNPSTVTPKFQIAPEFFNGANFTVGGGAGEQTNDSINALINNNNILNPGDTETVGIRFKITQQTSGLGLGEVYPSRSFIFNIPSQLQQYFRLEIGSSDSGVSTSASDFSARMDFPLVEINESPPETGEINLILRTDLAAYPAAGSGLTFITSTFPVEIRDEPGGNFADIISAGPMAYVSTAFQINVQHRLSEEPVEPTPNIKIVGTSIDYVALVPNDGSVGSGTSGNAGNAGLISVVIENQGDAGGYYVLESVNAGGDLNLFVSASAALEESPVVLGTYKRMISTQAGNENPSAFTTEPLDSYINYLDAGATTNYAVRFNTEGPDFEYIPPEIIFQEPIVGPYGQMGQVGTNGTLSIGLKQFDTDFSGTGVDVALLESLAFTSGALVEYEVISDQELGEASIRPDLNSTLVKSPGNFLQSNNQLLHEHMFDPDGDFGIQTGGDTYLLGSFPAVGGLMIPIINQSMIDDTIADPSFLNSNEVGHLLGFTPGGSTFDASSSFGGGLNFLNQNANPNAVDVTFSVFVDTIPPLANRVKSADTDPIGYTGALPTQIQPWATAGSSFHNPQVISGNENYQSPVGAQGSLGYMVFWTDPISLSDGFDPTPLPSGEYHYVNLNSSFVYAAATSQYQSYLGGFRQANIQVPSNHFVKCAIFPFYTVNTTQIYLNDIILAQQSGMPDFGGSVGGSPNGGPLATRFTVSVSNASNNQVFNGQIMHALATNDITVIADGESGPSKRIPSSTPPPEESRSSVNSSSQSSVSMSRSRSNEVGSLSYAPSKPTKAKLRSARNKSKKKRK